MADLLAYLYFLHFTDEPGNSGNGKRLFTDVGCSRCHGLDGKKGEVMDIDLSKHQKASNPMDIVAGIWNHSGEIDKAVKEKGLTWPRLKKGEMADLLEYIRTRKKN
jgi:mono/diheme cytochrome c family protein